MSCHRETYIQYSIYVISIPYSTKYSTVCRVDRVCVCVSCPFYKLLRLELRRGRFTQLFTIIIHLDMCDVHVLIMLDDRRTIRTSGIVVNRCKRYIYCTTT